MLNPNESTEVKPCAWTIKHGSLAIGVVHTTDFTTYESQVIYGREIFPGGSWTNSLWKSIEQIYAWHNNVVKFEDWKKQNG